MEHPRTFLSTYKWKEGSEIKIVCTQDLLRKRDFKAEILVLNRDIRNAIDEFEAEHDVLNRFRGKVKSALVL